MNTSCSRSTSTMLLSAGPRARGRSARAAREGRVRRPRCRRRVRHGRGEMLGMHVGGRPVRGGSARCAHEPGRSAVIHVGAGVVLPQQCGKVQPLRRLAAVVVEGGASRLGKRLDALAECRALGTARAVMQEELALLRLQLGGHGHHGVTPMPPAMSRCRRASRASGKKLRGTPGSRSARYAGRHARLRAAAPDSSRRTATT